MDIDTWQAIGVGFGAIVLCTAHFCAGLVLGNRGWSAPGGRYVPPDAGHVLVLLEQSQKLQLQLIEHAHGLPERVLEAAAGLVHVARQLQEQVRPTSAAPTASSRQIGRAEREDILVKSGADQRHCHLAQTIALQPSEVATVVPELEDTKESRPYPTQQFLAFFEYYPPGSDCFESVLCSEISIEGISFFLPRRPDAELVVITLGSAPEFTFMLAKVKSYRPAFANDRKCFRIGCQFLRKLREGEYYWNEAQQAIEAGPMATSELHREAGTCSTTR